jgi:hypothetical protein
MLSPHCTIRRVHWLPQCDDRGVFWSPHCAVVEYSSRVFWSHYSCSWVLYHRFRVPDDYNSEVTTENQAPPIRWHNSISTQLVQWGYHSVVRRKRSDEYTGSVFTIVTVRAKILLKEREGYSQLLLHRRRLSWTITSDFNQMNFTLENQ